MKHLTPDPAVMQVAARYLGTSPWSHAAAKAGWPTTGMPSTVVKKPTFPVSVGGMKRTYSSGAPKAITNSIPMHAFLHQLLENGLTCSTAVFPRRQVVAV